MKRFSLKRLFVLLGAAMAVVAFVAMPASAAPPAPPTTCTGVMNNLNTLGDLIVPAGATCDLGFPKVAGNVTVAGTLFTYGYTFGKNVTVIGGTLALANGGSIAGNLSITGTRGKTTLGTPNAGSFHTIGGNLTYSGNALGIGDGLFIDHAKVTGNITVSNNSGHYWYNLFNSTAGKNITVENNTTAGGPIQLSGNTATRNLTCTGNVPAPRIPSWGTVNTAGMSVLGQCAGLQPTYAPNQVVATGTIDSSALDGTTTAALLMSGNYRIDVSGTYNSLHNVADAEFVSVDNWATPGSRATTMASSTSEKASGMCRSTGSSWTGAVQPAAHVLADDAALRRTVNLAVFDGDSTTKEAGWYADNSGSLNYTITYVGP